MQHNGPLIQVIQDNGHVELVLKRSLGLIAEAAGENSGKASGGHFDNRPRTTAQVQDDGNEANEMEEEAGIVSSEDSGGSDTVGDDFDPEVTL